MSTTHVQRGTRALRVGRHANGRSFHSPSLHVELLEDRRLLSVTPELVLDIWPGSESSGPRFLTNVSGALFFEADDGIHGEELWTSDGTPEGTRMIKDIRPGGDDSSLNGLTGLNGTAYFEADDGVHGRQLWKSDGTSEGTVMVTIELRHISGRDMTNVNGTLFFGASDGIHGSELWKSDGSLEGTVMIKDITPGSDGSNVNSLTNVNGTLFFLVGLDELWRSDGTTEGTIFLRHFPPSTRDVSALTSVGATLFFTADDGVHGEELWKSEGTPESTRMVKDISPGRTGPFLPWAGAEIVDFNGTAFFGASLGLWKSDGTANGTQLVYDLPAAFPYELKTIGEKLMFGNNFGDGFWISDGTMNGTSLAMGDLRPRSITNVNGTAFFRSAGLWKSDGTPEGTVFLHDLRPLRQTNVNGTLFIVAFDGIHGSELWVLEAPAGDTNYDGIVDVTDLDNVRNNFGRESNSFPGDTTGDGVVNIDDLNAVRNNFGAETPASARRRTTVIGYSANELRAAKAEYIARPLAETHHPQPDNVTSFRELVDRAMPANQVDIILLDVPTETTSLPRIDHSWRAARGHEVDKVSTDLWDDALLELVPRHS